MILPKGKFSFRVLIVALGCFGLGGVLIGLGYWAGQRSEQHTVNAAVPKGSPASQVPSSLTQINGVKPIVSITAPNIPANASAEMKEFLQNRAILVQKSAELRKSNPNGPPDQQKLAQYMQDNAALFARQKELSQKLFPQQTKNPLPTPPPLQIPPNATPQMKDYLTARDQLMRDQITFMNHHRTDDPTTRQAAMQQWRQQNATRIQQIQQQAQALAQTTVGTTSTATSK